jgi:hypothetical protein
LLSSIRDSWRQRECKRSIETLPQGQKICIGHAATRPQHSGNMIISKLNQRLSWPGFQWPIDCILVFVLVVLASFVLVYPVAAIIMLARPTSKNAKSLPRMSCHFLWAATSVLSAKAILLPERTKARLRAVFGLCRNLACAAVYSSHVHPCLQCQPEMLAVVLLFVHSSAVSRPSSCCCHLLHQSPLPMVRRG